MIGRKIENSINLLMEINDSFAKISDELDKANDALTMYQNLFEINKYINTDISKEKIIDLIDDVIRGIIGATKSILVTKDKEIYNVEDFKIKYSQLVNIDIDDFLYLEDLNNQKEIDIMSGSLFIKKITTIRDEYGFIVSYWNSSNSLDNKKLNFIRILSMQLELGIKNAMLIDEFKLIAVNDPLTGIYNRSYFENIKNSTTPKIGEGIIMFDIDNFKSINDSLGHSYGDDVLRTFANILKTTILEDESAKIAFKYGGEEFVVITENGENEAHRIADLIRLKFKEYTGYTVSCGVSIFGKSVKIKEYSRAVDIADNAMYMSKQCGKNKTTVSNSDIQIFDISSKELGNILINSFEKKCEFNNVIRLDVLTEIIMSEEEKEELNSYLKMTVRKDDLLFSTDSLSFLFLIKNYKNINDLIERIKGCMLDYYPNIEYDLYNLNNMFKEVIEHSEKCEVLSEYIGEKFDFKDYEIKLLKDLSKWHDIGKICISPKIYEKQTSISELEFLNIVNHPWFGYSLTKKNDNLSHLSELILKHHENYDGSGYFKFEKDEIPFIAQLFSLIDRYSALIEKRAYREEYSKIEAIKILEIEKNKHDKELFDYFIKILREKTSS